MKNQDPLLKTKERFTTKKAREAVGRFATDVVRFTGDVAEDSRPLIVGTLAAGAIAFGSVKVNEAERANPNSTPIEVVQADSIAEDVPVHIGNGNVLTLPPNPTVNGIHYPKNPPGNGPLPR